MAQEKKEEKKEDQGTKTPGAVAGLAGSILGSMFNTGGDDISAGSKARQEMLSNIQNLSVPERDKLLYSLRDYSANTIYDPKQEQAQQAATNYFDDAKTDPAMRAKQMEYMQTLQDISKQGMTAPEEAQKNALMRQLAGQQQGAASDIERQMQSKGMGSSGASLLAKLQGQQQSQSNAAQQSESLLSQLFNRKLGAQGQMSDLAGNLDQTDFQRAMSTGQAKSGLDQFNTQQRAAVQQRNVGAQNLAAQQNWQNQQDVANKNVGNRQDEAKNAANSYQATFNNQLQKSGLLTKALDSEADYRTKKGQASNASTMDMAKGAAQIGAAAYTGGASALFAAHGGVVKGNEVVDGDSEANDIKHYMLSPGEAIIPKSIMENPNAGELAKHFVNGLLKSPKKSK
jgi:hypothetical protein